MGTCATCKFWHTLGHAANEPRHHCGISVTDEGGKATAESLAVAHTEVAGGESWLETRAVFGCVQWEAK